jgi:hypothetical protein
MNNYCIDLKFDFSPLKEGFDPYSIPIGHTKLDEQYISDEFFQLINSLDLRLLYMEVFVKGPNFGPGIHLDHGRLDMAKLNWVYGGKGSRMCWYKQKKGIQFLPKIHTTPIKSYSLLYNIDIVDLMYEREIGFPSLVQSGVPHGIYTADETRYCYSAVLFTKDWKRLKFSEMVELFKDYIVPVNNT